MKLMVSCMVSYPDDGSIEMAFARRVIDLSGRSRRNDEAGNRSSRQRREENARPDISNN